MNPIVHYAPYGCWNPWWHKYDCGADWSEGNFTENCMYVTCDKCKDVSPGLWWKEEDGSYRPRFLGEAEDDPPT